MESLRMVVVGPGRAGGSLAIAARRAGHEVVGIVVGPSRRIPEALEGIAVFDDELPEADLVVVSVRDDVIADVARWLSERVDGIPHACHLSGFTSIEALGPLREAGCGVGSLHPVQSLPDPETGAAALHGSHAAITADVVTRPILDGLARSIGMTPFPLADSSKPLHHAAASAASNFVVAALAVAQRLADEAGAPTEAYRALTIATVDGAYRLGPVPALTGPVSRGDIGTVRGQLEAAASVSSELRAAYAELVLATASFTEHRDEFERLVRGSS